MIVIAPFTQKLRNGKTNPKQYPFWKELIEMIDEPIVQVGIQGEEQLVDEIVWSEIMGVIAELEEMLVNKYVSDNEYFDSNTDIVKRALQRFRKDLSEELRRKYLKISL